MLMITLMMTMMTTMFYLPYMDHICLFSVIRSIMCRRTWGYQDIRNLIPSGSSTHNVLGISLGYPSSFASLNKIKPKSHYAILLILWYIQVSLLTVLLPVLTGLHVGYIC